MTAKVGVTPTPDHLHGKAADLAAKQQKKAAERRREEQSIASDRLTIGGIRSLPGMTPDVERVLATLQSIVPSLARAPTAPAASGQTFQPAGVLAGIQMTPGQLSQPGQLGQATGGQEYDTEFVYNPARGKFVRVVNSPTRLSTEHSNFGPGKSGVSNSKNSPQSLGKLS